MSATPAPTPAPTPAIGTTLPRDEAARLARSLIVHSTLLPKGGRVSLDLDPTELRRLGRALEAMSAFEDHPAEVLRNHTALHAVLIAAQAEAVKARAAAVADLRKSLWLTLASMGWCTLSLAFWWFA